MPQSLLSAALPNYALELAAEHRAHATDLRSMIDDLPISKGGKVLDMACGDGFFTRLLGERVGAGGVAVGADASLAYLEVAEDNFPPRRSNVQYLVAKIESLPFRPGTFDMAWCADSLISLHSPEWALGELRSVVRKGGWIAVMETDSLHEALLPWPPDLELAVRTAVLRAYQANSRRPRNRYIGRSLCELISKAGFTEVRQQVYSIDRTAPLPRADCEYLQKYLARLEHLVSPFLNGRDRLRAFVDPDSPLYLARRFGMAISWFKIVCLGKKDGGGLPDSRL